MTKKLEVYRWQFELMVGLLMTKQDASFDTIWTFLSEHFQIIRLPQKGGEMPVVYVFYGYKQDAVRYRIENNIDPKDMVLAREWRKLEGLRARPVIIDQGSKWSDLNWNHEFSIRTRQLVHELEVKYGSA